MKKKKLVIIFDEDSVVGGLEQEYVFDNEKDCENFFLSYGFVKEFKIDTDFKWFSFKGAGWNGGGKCVWATYI